MSRSSAMSGSFEAASADLKAYSRLDVKGRSVQRMAGRIGPDLQDWIQNRAPTKPNPAPSVLYVSYDGTGVPTTKSETQDQKGKQPDGSSKTREVKLECVFTQRRTLEGQLPDRDPDSTTYVASFDGSVDFGGIIREEVILRGMAYAKVVVFLGDGAPWIWSWLESTSPVLSLFSISTTPLSTSTASRHCSIPTSRQTRDMPKHGVHSSRKTRSMTSSRLSPNWRLLAPPKRMKYSRLSTTSLTTAIECYTPRSARRGTSPARGLSRRAAKPSSANGRNSQVCSGM